MKTHRPLRVQSVIQRELGMLLMRELEFPNALVTITEVEVNKKMDIAKVRVGVFPAKRSVGVMRKLKKAEGALQYLLIKRMNIRPMPKIRFEIDVRPEHAAQVEKILLDEQKDP